MIASLVAQKVKNLPAIQETEVWSLGWENPLEKGMATHSGILAWRIPWTEEPGRLQSIQSQRVRHDWAAFTFDPAINWHPNSLRSWGLWGKVSTSHINLHLSYEEMTQIWQWLVLLGILCSLETVQLCWNVSRTKILDKVSCSYEQDF